MAKKKKLTQAQKKAKWNRYYRANKNKYKKYRAGGKKPKKKKRK